VEKELLLLTREEVHGYSSLALVAGAIVLVLDVIGTVGARVPPNFCPGPIEIRHTLLVYRVGIGY